MYSNFVLTTVYLDSLTYNELMFYIFKGFYVLVFFSTIFKGWAP